MKMNVWGCCDKGRVRSRNEDMVLIGEVPFRNATEQAERATGIGSAPFFTAVADGVGGNPAGDQASRFILENAVERLSRLVSGLSDRQLADQVEYQLREVNRDLVSLGWLGEKRIGMSSTLSGIFWYEDKSLVVHAGDSRIYCFQNGRVLQVTRDHTLREQMKDPSIPGNIIVNCFGMENDFYLELKYLKCDQAAIDTTIVICSDGVSVVLDDPHLSQLCRDLDSAQQIGERIVQDVLERGAPDNISAVVIRPEINDD